MMINHLNPIIDVRFFRKDCVSFIISWRHGIYICWLYISRVSRKSNIFLPVQHVQAVNAGSNVASSPHSNKDSESVVFNSGQKMALRAIYLVSC